METKDTTYNGWTNYETWNVKLWIDNDQGSQEYWQEEAQDAYDRSEKSEYFTREEEASFLLRERLKDQHEEYVREALEKAGQSASFIADLLNGALSEVNWQEIAESLLEDVKKE